MELSKLLWVVKIDVIDDREGATDGVSQATTAGFVETGGETINNTKKQELPVLGFVFDKLFSTCDINLIGDCVRDLVRKFLLESVVIRSSTDGGHIRSSGALMVIRFLDDSVDVNAFLWYKISMLRAQN